MKTRPTKPAPTRCLWQQGFRDTLQRLTVTLMLVMLTAMTAWATTYTVTLKAGEGSGDDVTLNSVDDYYGTSTNGSDVPNGKFFTMDSELWFRSPACPETFNAPDGKVFAGWNNGSLSAGNLFPISGDLSLTAFWDNLEFFEANSNWRTKFRVTSTSPYEVQIKQCLRVYIANLTIPASVNYGGIDYAVTSIGKDVFKSVSNLQTVEIPASVTSIGQEAFNNCNNLATVTFATGSQLETIGNGAFRHAGLTSITIPNGVMFIGDSAFGNCTGLTSITIPTSVTSICGGAFKGCTNLSTVTLNSNPNIGMFAFDDIKDGATVTMNLTANSADGAYWMTFYNYGYSFEADANTQVFKAALSDKSLTLTELTTDKIVQSDKAVILKSTASPIVMTLTTGGSNDFTGNQLAGVEDSEGKTSDGTMYVLNYKDGTGVGFYKLQAGSKLGVGKAYLTYSGTTAPSFFGFEDNTEIPGATDISTTDFTDYTDKPGAWYTLSGVRLNAKPTQKGLYIVNGKTVVIK